MALPGGVSYGMTRREVEALYGPPTYYYESRMIDALPTKEVIEFPGRTDYFWEFDGEKRIYLEWNGLGEAKLSGYDIQARPDRFSSQSGRK